MKKMIIALLLLLSVECWSACQSVNVVVGTFSGYTYQSEESVNTSCVNRSCDYRCTECKDEYYSGGFVFAGIVETEVTCTGFDAGCGTPARWCSVRSGNCRATVRCDRTCEVDSLKGCPNGYVWNSDSCKCVGKPSEADSTFTICTEDVRNGNVYSSIYSVTCHYSNGTATQCCGVSPNSISGEGYKSYCPMVRQERGTCEQNGVPNGPSPPSNGTVPFLPTAQCYAVVGYTCYMRDYASGRTYSCECDGSCTNANMGQVTGLRCRNPYPQPTQSSSSESGGGSSSPSSSDSGGGSSSPSSSESGGGSSSPSSGTSGIDYTEQLNQLIANTQGIMDNTGDISEWTQTTMNNTTDIKNGVSNIGIDVGHIRDNTQQTANNTGSIDSKLSTTNSLLDAINNKEWSPNINVAGDTNIINVTVGGDTNIINVQGDTAKSGFAILEYLKNIFGGSDTSGWNGDTSGWSGIFSQMETTGDSTYNANSEWFGSIGCDTTGGNKCDNAIIGAHGLDSARAQYRTTYGMLKDSLQHGAFADSLAQWGEKFTGNGVIAGSGSDNCPSVLTKTWHVTIYKSAGYDFSLGTYLCAPILGGVTAWTLCRLLLRASVALACMWFLFKCAIGFKGDND